MLISMTFVTGLVDAFSLLLLGHVFVANMTGNVVFLALALAGAKGFSIIPSAIALVSFVIGTLGAGHIVARHGAHRGRILVTITSIQAIFLGAGIVLATFSGNPVPTAYSYALIVALAISMGLQNTMARKLAVPDLTTTVLTMTIVGMGADSSVAGGSGSRIGRRLIAVLAMFIGAGTGALLILYSSIVLPIPIWIAFLIIAFVAVAGARLSRKNPPWVNSK